MDEIKDAMYMWLGSQWKTFFTAGITKLVNCYLTCNLGGGEGEKEKRKKTKTVLSNNTLCICYMLLYTN
jgi:hypothetical protein